MQLLLTNKQAPGDVLMLTAAVRDLHLQYPDYDIAVDTSEPCIWDNNPHIKKVDPTGARLLRVGYSSSIRASNQRRAHFITGFHQHLSELLGIRIIPGVMRPDVYLTDVEKSVQSRPIAEPYLLLNAGGKLDFTAKVWSQSRWQKVVDLLKNDIRIIQVGKLTPGGSAVHNHPRLQGVLDMLGKTDFRQLMTLCYHAAGTASCVTALMHLAAAFNKPATVVDGGREPWWWEAYTRETWKINSSLPVPDDLSEHTYLTALGRLPCCMTGGCWKSGIGEKPANNCTRLIAEADRSMPECLSLIEPEQVVQAIRNGLNRVPTPMSALSGWLKPPLFMEPLSGQLARVQTTDQQRFDGMRTSAERARLPQPRYAADTMTPAPLDPVTVCVLAYGDYPHLLKTCLDSLYRTVPAGSIRLRLGLNAVSAGTQAYVKELCQKHQNVRVFESAENIFKYPMMRRMFWDTALDTDWMIWLDDDSSFVQPDWFRRFSHICTAGKPDVLGQVHWMFARPGQADWIKAAKWYTGRPARFRTAIDGPKQALEFVTGGFWACRTDVLKKLDWPDPRIQHNGGDRMFGEACYQNRLLTANFSYGVRINGHPGRGVQQAPVGSTA